MSCAAVSYAERSVCRFKAFHERYYHPSNARFWFYGDDPAEERLRLLSNFLDNFEERHVDSTVKPQPLFAVSGCSYNCSWCQGDRHAQALS